ncbi:MAG: nuclear transport factor 2 family protein [Actinobacteria bacterium]|nr:MAG: nuclear transport factor 2 family protein [Actinomycetota bacterium]
MAHPNEALLRKGYEAFASYDLDTIRALFADDIVWHVGGGRNPLTGTIKGKDEVFGWFAKLLTLSDGTFKIDVHDVIANDNHAVVLSTDTAQRGDKSLRVEAVAVYHIDNGQVTEAWFFNSDAYADDEFFS